MGHQSTGMNPQGTAGVDGAVPVELAYAPHHATGAERVIVGIGRRVAIISSVLILVASAITWQVVSQGHARGVEYQARQVADIVTRMAASARSTYALNVTEKLRADGTGPNADYAHINGAVPLPAQFLKLMGQRASDESAGLFRYQPLSKWNLDESQGLMDDFQRWAWNQLELQDQADPRGPINWTPIWRIESNNGVRMLRYLRADPAVAQSCVDCHNQLEQSSSIISRRIRLGQPTNKQWRLHQLMGAIEVNVPLENVENLAHDESSTTLLVVSGVIVSGLFIIGFFLFMDISQARTMARKLAWQAHHDTLTELHNRPVFEQRLAMLVARAKIDNSQHALLFLNLDQFKMINDSCGHSAGDSLLHQLGGLLKSHLRGGDMLARIGGDEFGIVLENCTIEFARNIAEILRQATRDYRYTVEQRSFEVGVSIGMVSITRDSESVSSLLSAADVACHTAKSAGRNRIHVLNPGDAELHRHRSEVQWVTGITRALEEGRMRLVVQDAVQLPERVHGKVYQEILLRMIDEQGEPIPTGTVIPAAERFNLMGVIDRWVIRTTFALIQQGKLKTGADNVVAINLSGNSINDDEFLAFVRVQLVKFKVPSAHICFEITETAAIHNIEKAGQFIRTLKAEGCQFALDDFGAGSSSFNYLKHLPVDYLKIDGIFVRDIEKDSINRAMVEAVAKIGRVIGIATIAEWVESEAVLDQIRDIGIDFAQGYAVSRPRTLDVVALPPDDG
jgi:diguanylate cyclase (GGDEF)-like protein